MNWYDSMAASIRDPILGDHPDLHVQHLNTHTVLFKFRDNHDVDSNPNVCFRKYAYSYFNQCVWITVDPVLVDLDTHTIHRIVVESALRDHKHFQQIFTGSGYQIKL